MNATNRTDIPSEENNGSSVLEQEALNAIRKYKAELATYGLHVRSAMELEFVTDNEQGQPVKNAIKDTYVQRELRLHMFPGVYFKDTYIQDVGPEEDTTKTPYQHEIKIAEPTEFVHQFMPENIAITTANLKKGPLAEVLRNTTCLTYPQNGPIIANFSVLPHENKEVQHPHITSGLHANISLYDQHGNNLFTGDSDLKKHCADALLEIQRDAALTMLPREDSLKRIKANPVAPHGLGINRSHAERKNRIQ